MAHELWVVKDGTMTNITPIVGLINWKSNIEELGDELTFTLSYNDDRYFPQNVCDLGDLVILKNGDYEITRAVIVEENKSGRDSIGYTAFDYAFYLNKSNAIYQFNYVPANEAVMALLKEFNVPVYYIAAMPVMIDKLYNNKKVSEIIRDIMDISEAATGNKLVMEMRQGMFCLEWQEELIIQGLFTLAENLNKYDVLHAIMNPSKKRSIVNMRNYIQVVDKEIFITDSVDTDLMNKYGRLQDVLDISDVAGEPTATSVVNISSIIENKLKEVAKVFEESSVGLPGDDRFRAGRLFEITEPLTGLSGKYLITDVNHKISKGIHTMFLGLEAK